MTEQSSYQRQQSALARFERLLDTLETFTSGDADTDIDTSGGSVPSLRKWLAEQNPEIALAAFLGASGKTGDALRVGEYGHGANELPEAANIDELSNQCAVKFDDSAVLHLPLVSNLLAVQLRFQPITKTVAVRFQVLGEWSLFMEILTQANTIADSNGLIRTA